VKLPVQQKPERDVGAAHRRQQPPPQCHRICQRLLPHVHPLSPDVIDLIRNFNKSVIQTSRQKVANRGLFQQLRINVILRTEGADRACQDASIDPNQRRRSWVSGMM
jgi:hypothetical protein